MMKRVLRWLAVGIALAFLVVFSVGHPGLVGTVHAQKDPDGDGVPPNLDRCPDEAGDPLADGCPLFPIQASNVAGLVPLMDLPYESDATYTSVTDLAYMIDGSRLYILYADTDHAVAWDMASGIRNELPIMDGRYLAELSSIDVAMGGLLFLGAHYDSTSNLNWMAGWSAVDWELEVVYGNNSHMEDMAVSPDGDWVATSGYNSLNIWPVATSGEIQRPTYSLASDSQNMEGFKDLAWHPDSTWIAVYSWYSNRTRGSTIHIYDLDTRSEIAAVQVAERLSTVAFSTDGSLLVAGDTAGVLRSWDTATWTLTGEVAAYNYPVYGMAFSPVENLLATLGGREPTQLILWDAHTLTPLLTVPDVEGVALAFRPDGKVLATGYQEDDIRFWGITDPVVQAVPDVAVPAVSATAAPSSTPDEAGYPGSVTGNVNVRSGPGTNAAIVETLSAGATLTVQGRNAAGDWLYVEIGELKAWIFASLVTTTAPLADLPIVDESGAAPAASVPAETADPQATATGGELCQATLLDTMFAYGVPEFGSFDIIVLDPGAEITIVGQWAGGNTRWYQLDNGRWLDRRFLFHTDLPSACAQVPTVEP